MAKRVPFTVPADWPDRPEGKFAASINLCRDDADAQVCLLGLPDDLGVRLNHGRPGAAEGPADFRAALARFGAPFDIDRKEPIACSVCDAGDIEPAPGSDAKALRETHRRVTEAVTAIHQMGLMPVCIGGGHDLTYPSVRALAAGAGASLAGINLDAHLDVREEPGSGMPFRALIGEGCLDPRRFVTLGAGAFCNSEDHVRWFTRAGGEIIPVRHVARDAVAAIDLAFDHAMPARRDRTLGFVTIDMDAIDAAHAPGVSAMNPAGVSPHVAIEVARRAGRNRCVKHFDIMELSPPHDDNTRTARLAAHVFLSFLAGFSLRSGNGAP